MTGDLFAFGIGFGLGALAALGAVLVARGVTIIIGDEDEQP